MAFFNSQCFSVVAIEPPGLRPQENGELSLVRSRGSDHGPGSGVDRTGLELHRLARGPVATSGSCLLFRQTRQWDHFWSSSRAITLMRLSGDSQPNTFRDTFRTQYRGGCKIGSS